MVKYLTGICLLITVGCLNCFGQGKIERPSLSNKTSSTTGVLDGHKYVDLGLPSGTKWATCNIGTDKLDYYGDYFVWGNPTIITNDNLDWNLRPQYYRQSSFSGLSEYDPAKAIWGGRWHTPSKDEIESFCNFVLLLGLMSMTAVYGFKVRKMEGKYIFLHVEVVLELKDMTMLEL